MGSQGGYNKWSQTRCLKITKIYSLTAQARSLKSRHQQGYPPTTGLRRGSIPRFWWPSESLAHGRISLSLLHRHMCLLIGVSVFLWCKIFLCIPLTRKHVIIYRDLHNNWGWSLISRSLITSARTFFQTIIFTGLLWAECLCPPSKRLRWSPNPQLWW